MAVNATGVTLQAPRSITGNGLGRYSDLSLSTDPSGGAFLFARYTDGTNATLRVFDLDIGAPAADLDGDTIPDALELQIVDADPGDGLNSPADVLPGDDFDGDGHTNLEEIRLGLDPTNSSSALRIQGISLGTMCCGVDLILNTLDGKAMSVEGSSSLTPPVWTSLDTFTGDGFPKYLNVNSTNHLLHIRATATP
jgi:hypothetical protein